MIDDYNFTVNLSHDDPTSHPLKKNQTQCYAKLQISFHISFLPCSLNSTLRTNLTFIKGYIPPPGHYSTHRQRLSASLLFPGQSVFKSDR